MDLKDYFRETFAGRVINLISGGRLLEPPIPQIPPPDEKLGVILSLEPSLNRTLSRASLHENVEATDEVIETGASGKLVTWNGLDDPENPHNWPFWMKLYSTGVVCFLTFSIYIGSAIYTTGIAGIDQKFGVSSVVSVLGLSLFVFGYGIGPMIIVPFQESLPIGRMPVYAITHLTFLFFNFGVVYADNIGMLLAFRFLTGFFGSPVIAAGGSSIMDMWPPKQVAYAIGTWGNFAVCGPVLGPLISGFAVQAKDWTWSIWILIWLNGVCAIVLIFTLPETSNETILYRRAKRIRKLTGDPEYKSAAQIEEEKIPLKEVIIASTLRPFQLCFFEPILLVQNVYLGLVYAVLYCWFEAFPLVFGEIYGFDLGKQGLAFLGILVGAFAATPPYFYWIHKKILPEMNDDGTVEPEKRLPAAIVGSFFIPVCLFWFGWSARPSVHWIMPIIGSGWFSFGATFFFNAVLSYQGDAYPRVIGSVLAGNDFMRAAFGGAFPVFATAMFRNLGIDWGCSLLGFLSIAFIPIPIAIYYYGKRLRMASKFARHDI